MTFHKAKEEYKWKQWKEQEEKILRESGVSERGNPKNPGIGLAGF